MSTPCACGSIRATLMGEVGRQVWPGGWDEANLPTLAAVWLPRAQDKGGLEARPGRLTLCPQFPRTIISKVSVGWERQAQEISLLPNWLGGCESPNSACNPQDPRVTSS